MAKFKIPTVPQTTSKSIRFPNDLIEAVEQHIQGKDCTFIPPRRRRIRTEPRLAQAGGGFYAGFSQGTGPHSATGRPIGGSAFLGSLGAMG